MSVANPAVLPPLIAVLDVGKTNAKISLVAKLI